MTHLKCFFLSNALMFCVWLGSYADWLAPRIAKRLMEERKRQRGRLS
ncbi:MAG: hypothetical protein AAFR57_05475 [Pseudomonadota bacterium]